MRRAPALNIPSAVCLSGEAHSEVSSQLRSPLRRQTTPLRGVDQGTSGDPGGPQAVCLYESGVHLGQNANMQRRILMNTLNTRLSAVADFRALLAKAPDELYVVSGDESLLSRLPKGNWIGGTIPYLMTN